MAKYKTGTAFGDDNFEASMPEPLDTLDESSLDEAKAKILNLITKQVGEAKESELLELKNILADRKDDYLDLVIDTRLEKLRSEHE